MRAASLLVLFAAVAVSAQEATPTPTDGVAPQPPEHIYALPYKGRARRVSQASNGKTHKGSSKYAIDFSMRRGTPIYAARGGEVTVSVGHNVEVPRALKRAGAPKGAPNRVSIRHEDGTVAVYLHLQHEGVTVNVGQAVKTGDLIGYSGSTGKSSGPHLHFAVLKRVRRGKKRTIPVKFATTVSPATTLERGQRYRPPSKAKLY